MDDFYRNRSARLSDEIKRVVNEIKVSTCLFILEINSSSSSSLFSTIPTI
jgi:hypothetical protein